MMTEHEIEFVSYDGKYPCLCHGQLVIKVDGKLYDKGFHLCSGGSCGFISEGDDPYADTYREEGRWEVEVPEELEWCQDEIEKLVNENVTWGCCGGCI
jgi:hypothetical protein